MTYVFNNPYQIFKESIRKSEALKHRVEKIKNITNGYKHRDEAIKHAFMA